MTCKLYCFGESGNAYKVALTLQLLGRDWTAQYVDFFGGETRTPAFRAINPMGEIPVLVETDGTVLNFLPADKRPEGAISYLQGRMRAALQTLEGQLGGRAWLAGTDQPSIADCAACSYLYYPEPFGFDRADWPAIDAWLGRLSAQPGWAHPYDLMPGNPSDRAR